VFTGIIEELGTIKNINIGSQSSTLYIECINMLNDLKIGDSVSVNGVCLTVTTKDNNSFSADVMPETFKRTNLSRLKIHDKVNLERALKLSDRLNGHIVSGNVDGTARIINKTRDENAILISL
jgi:riboflavin synthase